MVFSTPSASFYSAVSHLSHTSNAAKVGTTVKLELYGLFKYLTVTHAPGISKPSIFDPTARAKWHAWNGAYEKYGDDGFAQAEDRYKEISVKLGWNETELDNSLPSVPIAIADEQKEEEEINWDDDKVPPSRGAGGMGKEVSAMSAPDADPEDALTVHGLAIANEPDKLRTLVLLDPQSINEPDEFGYTPLHLASDRGNTAVVEVLLGKGADKTKQDQDGFTALELARIAGHADIIALLV